MKMKHFCCLVVLLICHVLSACSPDPDFEVYEGGSLTIAVVGEPPAVEEEQVTFSEISFDELSNDLSRSYDAVIVTEDNLQKASESHFADVYLDSHIPYFFLSAKSHIPFTLETETYSEAWKWSKGTSYAVGILPSKQDESLKSWGFSLYNDEKKDEYINSLYSRIFEIVEEQSA
jgi:hypothetical protein